ncbi:MAG: hypothetical protein JNL38_11735 [Myxococcales bacterium]|jgi:hypothetical protein|nr:hypothetical protein [Myxococcales bacterium]
MKRAALGIGFLLALGACFRLGSDEIGGGDIVHASSPPVRPPEPSEDGGASDGSTDGNLGACFSDPPVDRATWTGLYDDFFGPTGKASCGKNECHSKDGDDGEIATKAGGKPGFVCRPDKNDCYARMVGAGLALTSIPAGGSGEDTILHGSLRHARSDCKSRGNMPFDKTYTFTAADMKRVRLWLEAGAKND